MLQISGGQMMKKDLQSHKNLLLCVDSHLDVPFGAVFSLVLVLFIQIKQVIWNFLIGLNLLEFTNELASNEPEPMMPR